MPMIHTADEIARIRAANAHFAATSPVLARALDRWEIARNVAAAHAAGVLMLRESGADGRAIRAAQARLNGKRTLAGKAANRVLQAGGYPI